MSPSPGTPSPTSAVISHFRVKDRHYEARLVDCGKRNCSRCGGHGPRHPSHGPYWYLCFTFKARWYRQYLGKDIDTTRYVTDQGNLDIHALMAKRHSRTLHPAEKSPEAPGQLECNPPGGPPGPEDSGEPQPLLPSPVDPHDPGPVPHEAP